MWTTRGRIPPKLGEPPADLQSIVGESTHATANVVSLLCHSAPLTWKCMGPVWSGRSGTRSRWPIVSKFCDSPFVVEVLSVGLSPGFDDDLPCLARVTALGEVFTEAVTSLRIRTFSHYCLPSQASAQGVLCKKFNDDLGLRVSELMRASQPTASIVTPVRFLTLTRCLRSIALPNFVLVGGRCSRSRSTASVAAGTGLPSGWPPLP